MKMKWLNPEDSGGLNVDCEKVLHLQVLPGQPFKPYTEFPNIMKPDHMLPKPDGTGYEIAGSRGYATMQALLKSGWELVKSI